MTKQEKKREATGKKLTRILCLVIAAVMVITVVISALFARYW